MEIIIGYIFLLLTIVFPLLIIFNLVKFVIKTKGNWKALLAVFIVLILPTPLLIIGIHEWNSTEDGDELGGLVSVFVGFFLFALYSAVLVILTYFLGLIYRFVDWVLKKLLRSNIP